MELQLEPKNSRAPNPYGSFPWMLGEELCDMRQFKTFWISFCAGPNTTMCGRDPGDFIDITITSCPPEVRFTLSAPTNDHHQQCDNDFINIYKECFWIFEKCNGCKAVFAKKILFRMLAPSPPGVHLRLWRLHRLGQQVQLQDRVHGRV